MTESMLICYEIDNCTKKAFQRSAPSNETADMVHVLQFKF